MGLQWITEVVDQQRWLDPVGDALQRAVAGAYAAGGPTGQQIKDFLHGVWLGHPLHPVLTDVPLGAWTVALVLDALEGLSGRDELAPGADAAVAVGLAGAAAAAVAGVTDWEHTDGAARREGLVHGLMNVGITLLYTVSLVERRHGARGAGRNLAALGYGASMVSAYIGGHLIYERRIGVDHSADQTPPHDFTRVLAAAELPNGEPRRVDVDGMPIMVVRRGRHIYALAETCSHLGGPLAEGRIEDDSVVCPWHGSRFALQDGRVLNGPSTFPQPTLETRVRNGQVEVRVKRG